MTPREIGRRNRFKAFLTTRVPYGHVYIVVLNGNEIDGQRRDRFARLFEIAPNNGRFARANVAHENNIVPHFLNMNK
tara:strand:+ start:3290 stop:3520 length:231 start_codon:yes stop_codon:yes gene_type:complete